MHETHNNLLQELSVCCGESGGSKLIIARQHVGVEVLELIISQGVRVVKWLRNVLLTSALHSRRHDCCVVALQGTDVGCLSDSLLLLRCHGLE